MELIKFAGESSVHLIYNRKNLLQITQSTFEGTEIQQPSKA